MHLLVIGVTLASATYTVAQEPAARARYRIVQLATLGGKGGAGNAINNRGWVMGAGNLPGDTTQHATIWVDGTAFDLGTLGGPSSSIPWPSVKNDHGIVVGISDTATPDPQHEIWSCAEAFFPTSSGNTCLGFVWRRGVMTPLPTLGGNNGVATGINNRDQIVGWAETGTVDSTCNAPQVYQFEPYVYDLHKQHMQALPPLAGDPDGAATAINDHGQIVGISGICSNAVGGATAAHAVLWENGQATNIGNLGGVAWNTPTSINNRGDVVGFSDLPGDSAASPNFHAFLRRRNQPMQDLGTLPGDSTSIAWSINDRGQIVGQSTGANGSRAFIWQNGVMQDLNSLVPKGTILLVYANDIDSSGRIVGGASDSASGRAPAFLAIPER